MFSFLLENNLVSSSQSGFKPGDFCLISYRAVHMKSFNHLMKALKLGALSRYF